MELIFVDKNRRKPARAVGYNKIGRKPKDDNTSMRDYIERKYIVEAKFEAERVSEITPMSE